MNNTTGTIKRKIIIKNKTGLHARPASLFVQIANKYDSDISVKKDGQVVNGKSIMGILMLAAEKGSTVTIIAKGEDAKEAVDELADLLLTEDMDEDWNGKGKKSKKRV